MNELINIEDFRLAAKRSLPRFVWDSIEGGASDEKTMRRNSSAFDDLVFRPRPLVDVSKRTLETSILGQPVAMPLMLAPTGSGRLIHGAAELLAARAASAAGTIYALSSVAREPEEVAASTDGPLWFQLYVRPTREETEALVLRAQASGFGTLCVTVDAAFRARHERDIRNRLKPPVRIRPTLVAQAVAHPRWSFNFAKSGGWKTFQYRQMQKSQRPTGLREVENAMMRAALRPVTWDELSRLRDIWPGKFVVKGILRADECPKLVDMGVDGIVVSNHGGRQLDGVSSTIEALPEVVDAVADRIEVMIDGGFRRGGDAVKALALGARAVLVGRPYLYGLAVDGEQGVKTVLEIFRSEIDSVLALLGCQSIADIEPSMLGGGSLQSWMPNRQAAARPCNQADVRSDPLASGPNCDPSELRGLDIADELAR